MATAALVCGIIALVISTCGSAANLAWVGSVCGILGIVFGALGQKDPNNKGKAKAGLIMSIIALTWGIIATIVCVACIGGAAAIGGSALSETDLSSISDWFSSILENFN